MLLPGSASAMACQCCGYPLRDWNIPSVCAIIIAYLSTDLKQLAGFGREGEKNFPGIVTQLQMETYLVISGFRRRKNRRGKAYGMPVSILLPPESIWGYDTVMAAYSEEPKVSWKRLIDRVRELYPHADEKAVIRLIDREPGE